MPARSVNGLPADEGPAIQMDPPDHQRTASHGSQGLAGAQFRAKQAELISKGRFGEAIQMEVDDIRSKFGSKYDAAIKEMIDSLDTNMRVGLRG
jgi:filamentous hemagglutinin